MTSPVLAKCRKRLCQLPLVSRSDCADKRRMTRTPGDIAEVFHTVTSPPPARAWLPRVAGFGYPGRNDGNDRTAGSPDDGPHSSQLYGRSCRPVAVGTEIPAVARQFLAVSSKPCAQYICILQRIDTAFAAAKATPPRRKISLVRLDAQFKRVVGSAAPKARLGDRDHAFSRNAVHHPKCVALCSASVGIPAHRQGSEAGRMRTGRNRQCLHNKRPPS